MVERLDYDQTAESNFAVGPFLLALLCSTTGMQHNNNNVSPKLSAGRHASGSYSLSGRISRVRFETGKKRARMERVKTKESKEGERKSINDYKAIE